MCVCGSFLIFGTFPADDLNATHQHCVLAGLPPRFSSTHRVAEVSVNKNAIQINWMWQKWLNEQFIIELWKSI